MIIVDYKTTTLRTNPSISVASKVREHGHLNWRVTLNRSRF